MRAYAGALAGALTLGLASPADGVPISPGDRGVPLVGTTLAANPDLAGAIQYDRQVPFQIRNNRGDVILRGTLQDRVVRSSNTGTLIFMPRLLNLDNLGRQTFVTGMRLEGFGGVTTNIDFRRDGIGRIGPNSVSRSELPGDALDYKYNPNLLVPPDQGRFLSISTNADSISRGGRVIIFAQNDFGADVFSTTLSGISTPVSPSGTFNAQVQAIEVTQGVRGDIPGRTRGGNLFGSDSRLWTHVAGRRTVVRVYPRVSGSSGPGPAAPMTATLRGYREPGGLALRSLRPVNRLVTPQPGLSLPELRSEAARSWNFILPEDWTRGQIRLEAQINPAGAGHIQECAICAADNSATLPGVKFEPTGSVEFRMYLVRWPQVLPDGTVSWTRPGLSEIGDMLGFLRKTWPIADADGLSVLVRSAEGCVPNGTTCNDPLVDGPSSPQAQARLERDRLGVRAGDPILFPQILSAASPRGCSGHAGVPAPDYWTGACGPTFTHESTHAGPGRQHAGAFHGSLGAADPLYPDPSGHGRIEPNTFGFDLWDLKAVPPTTVPGDSGSHRHDFMSYGSPQWVSVYTWQAVAAWLKRVSTRRLSAAATNEAGRVDPATKPYLRLAGHIDEHGAALQAPAFQVTLPDASADHRGDGHYRLELRGATGRVLFERRFEPTTGSAHAHGDALFEEDVPAPPGLKEVRLLEGDTLLDRLEAAPGTPTVAILSPTAGEEWAAAGIATVVWRAEDPDGEALHYRVEGSPDGLSWLILGGSSAAPEAALDLATLAGAGPGWRIRVQASDGLNVGMAEVHPIDLAAKPPQPLVLEPRDGATFSLGQEIALLGQAADWLEGPLPEEQLEWLVDDQRVGNGQHAVVANLPEGGHRVQLRATNAAGLTQEVAVSIEVAADADHDGLPDRWEAQYGFDPLEPNASDDPDADQLTNWQEFEQGTNPLLEDTDGDQVADSIEIAGGRSPTDPASLPRSVRGFAAVPSVR